MTAFVLRKVGSTASGQGYKVGTRFEADPETGILVASPVAARRLYIHLSTHLVWLRAKYLFARAHLAVLRTFCQLLGQPRE